MLYGASGGEIADALEVADTLNADSIDTILAGNHIFTVMPEAWRAICQLKSNFKPTPGLRLFGVTLVVWFVIMVTANTIAYFVG